MSWYGWLGLGIAVGVAWAWLLHEWVERSGDQ